MFAKAAHSMNVGPDSVRKAYFKAVKSRTKDAREKFGNEYGCYPRTWRAPGDNRNSYALCVTLTSPAAQVGAATVPPGDGRSHTPSRSHPH